MGGRAQPSHSILKLGCINSKLDDSPPLLQDEAGESSKGKKKIDEGNDLEQEEEWSWCTVKTCQSK